MSDCCKHDQPSGGTMTTVVRVDGMSCQNCARHVREAIEGVTGVSSVRVDLDRAEAVVRSKNGTPTHEGLLQALSAAGYPSRVVDKPSESPEGAGAGWKLNVILGSAVTVPLMIAEWGFSLGSASWFSWVSFILVLPVQVFCGAKFYRGAWQQLKLGQSNMDTLVALGSTTAFLFSTYGLFFPHVVHHTYFMEASAIITLISVGHWLESLAGSRATQAIRQLLTLAPTTARRLGINNTEEEVSVASLIAGDRVVLRPGDRVPADGIVTDGNGAVDESMLTGESILVEKSPGGKLYTGTLNTNGHLICAVQETGEETALSHIITIVERAQNSRAQIQRLADRISSVFVPVVIVLAAVALLSWGLGMHAWEAGIINAVAVLIVACPCAMGLATPAAIMAGTNAGAKRGILIRDGTALEKTRGITTVVFDKTGTLTAGQPSLDREPLYFGDSHEVLSLVKTLATPSHHPVSRALAGYAKDAETVPLDDWKEESGSGVLAQSGNQFLRLGSLVWLEGNGISTSAVAKESSFTLIGLAADEKLLAVFSLSDVLRLEAPEVLQRLRRRNLEIYIISGDRPEVANAVGQALGLPASHVFGGVRPEGKIEKISSLQAEGRRVAFIGDGINDAPALSQADLGIAVSSASDVAKESADIVLLKADLRAVPEALELSHRTLLTIKQNLFWAFFYNAAAIPLAAFGLASPVICAAAMGLSDLFLLANSIRLLSWRPAHSTKSK